MSSRLAAINARCAAATPGPWRPCGDDREGCQCRRVWSTSADLLVLTAEEESGNEGDAPQMGEAMNNAVFAAHSRTDLPALVELCEALLRERSIFAADHFDNAAWRIADDAADAAIRRFEEGACS